MTVDLGFIDPTAGGGKARIAPAPRPMDLAGKVVGMIDNTGSAVLQEEFVPGLDGKLRYFRDLRVEMYRYLSTLLRRWVRDPLIYLCMESEDVWRETLGFSPVERGGLSHAGPASAHLNGLV